MKVLNKSEVCEQLALSPRALEGMVKKRQFPPPQRLGKRAVWSEIAVERWRAQYFHAQENWRPGA